MCAAGTANDNILSSNSLAQKKQHWQRSSNAWMRARETQAWVAARHHHQNLNVSIWPLTLASSNSETRTHTSQTLGASAQHTQHKIIHTLKHSQSLPLSSLWPPDPPSALNLINLGPARASGGPGVRGSREEAIGGVSAVIWGWFVACARSCPNGTIWE